MLETVTDFLDDIRPEAGAYGKDQQSKLDRYRDYRAVFMSADSTAEQGRRVLWDLLAQCRAFNSPVATTEHGTDVPTTFAQIGRQNIGRFLMRTLMEEPQTTEE